MIRWGIIGCGDVTERKSGPGFQNVEGSRLVAVMRRNAERAEDYAKRHGVPRWYSNANLLIHDAEVDAVYIATPPGSHLDYAKQVVAAGKPCYIEKPMARSYRECVEITETFAKANLPLFVAYYRRGLDRFLKARELVQTGKIGTVSGVLYRFSSSAHNARQRDAETLFPYSPTTEMKTELPWRLDATEAGGGLFLDLGCHTLDIIDFIVGELQDVSGEAGNVASAHAVEDCVTLSFRTETGAVGSALWNFASAFSEDMIQITGTEGRITLSTFGNEPVLLETGEETVTFDLPNPDTIQQPLIQTIVDALHGKGECPSTGITATRTSRVMDIALSGYYRGREDAFWTRPETWRG